jgi:uncharacterized membrane protein
LWPMGPIMLIITLVLVTSGLADRPLFDLGITPKWACLAILGMLAGNFMNVPIWSGLVLNIGSSVIPMVAVVTLFIRHTDWPNRWEILSVGLLVGVVLFLMGRWFSPIEPTELNLFNVDAQYLYALTGGFIAYAAGRAPRLAFIAAVFGGLGADIAHYINYLGQDLGRPWAMVVGGGGRFDTALVAGLLALMLATYLPHTPHPTLRHDLPERRSP